MATSKDVSHGQGRADRRTGGCALVTFVCAMVVLGAPGCCGWDCCSWRMPWEKAPERIAGITPPHERMTQLRELAEKGHKGDPAEQQRVSSQLAAEIRDEADPLLRAQIVRTLADYQTAESASVLRAAMEDTSAEVRMVACEAWGKRGGPEAAKILAERLGSDTNRDVRLAATRALGQTRDPAAVAGLGVALDDKDPAMQYRAVCSLRQVTGKDFGNDVNRWQQYVKGEQPAPEKPVSIAEQVRRLF
jgi:hypothetical protein